MNSETDIKDWDRIAAAYAARIEAQPDPCWADLQQKFGDIVGDVREKDALDLGCGQGWLTKVLADRGANVIGIDGSKRLIARARSLCPSLSFELADLADGLPELGRSFDLVIAHMVVMDIPRIDRLFESVAEVLKPKGDFRFTLPHPCFFMQKSHQDEEGRWFKKLTGYLKPETRRIESFGGHNHYHRPLSTYINTLAEAGLFVSAFKEPPHQGKSSSIDSAFLLNFPVFLMIAARKPTTGRKFVVTS